MVQSNRWVAGPEALGVDIELHREGVIRLQAALFSFEMMAIGRVSEDAFLPTLRLFDQGLRRIELAVST